MDTLTHALSGALVGRAAGPWHTADGIPPARVRAWVGLAAATFPDIEGIVRFVDEMLYIRHHRGETHSLLLLPLWALLIGGLFHRLYGRRYRLSWMVLIAGLGLAIHIGGDVITAYGTRIFAPVSRYAPAPGWVLVIDPWLTLLVVVALAASIRWPRPGNATAGLTIIWGFVLCQAALNHYTAAWGQQRAAALGWEGARVRALAQPFSPFNRMVIIERGGVYERARVNLVRARARPADPSQGRLRRLARSYRPLDDPKWERFQLFPDEAPARALARDAWWSRALEPYRGFAHHPVFYGLDREADGVCVWFTDLRYWYQPLPAPFRFGGCRRSGDPDWALYHLPWDGSRVAALGSS